MYYLKFFIFNTIMNLEIKPSSENEMKRLGVALVQVYTKGLTSKENDGLVGVGLNVIFLFFFFKAVFCNLGTDAEKASLVMCRG